MYEEAVPRVRPTTSGITDTTTYVAPQPAPPVRGPIELIPSPDWRSISLDPVQSLGASRLTAALATYYVVTPVMLCHPFWVALWSAKGVLLRGTQERQWAG